MITLHKKQLSLLLSATLLSFALPVSAADNEKLAKLTITGLSAELKAGLEKHLPVNQPTCKASKAEVSDYFISLKTGFRTGARALGYYDAEFTSGGKEVDGCWEITLGVEPGEPVRVVSQFIEVKGAGLNEPEFRKIMAAPPYQQNDILNHQLYEDFKTSLEETAETLGYLEAGFEQKQVTVDPIAYQASVNLVLNTGPRYTFGEVIVEQNILNDDLVKRFVKIKPGTPFSTESVIEQQQIFQRSGYYSRVTVDVNVKGAKNQQVPVYIKLLPAKRNKYKYTLGYGSDTGARVKAELDRRWTGPKGRKFEAAAQVSETLSELDFELIEPRENPDSDTLTYLMGFTYDTSNDVDSTSFNFGANYKRKVDDDWVQELFVNALFDRTQDDGDEPDDSILTLVGGRLSKTKTNDENAATTGWKIDLELQGALDNVLSDQSIARFEGSGKYIFPVGKGRLVNRMSVGYTEAGDLEDIPKSLRFFAGGADSVRGYDFEDIGTTNDSGSVIGGKHMLTGSIEYEHPIVDEWSVAFFLDAGDAFNDWDDMDMKYGIGFGGRYSSPIGPVRVDIGFPEGHTGDATFYLSVGPDL
ncbi:outer membrane protein assembly factor [Leucothrix sargassi]|nr:outer membrane protein assembly factor [Leucothrix sargassi]